MPKIKELGITVVPEGFGPVEIGPGGCGCTNITNPCLGCTRNWTFNCGWRTYVFCQRPTLQCTDCTYVPYSICGTTPRTVPVECQGGTLPIDPITPVCGGSMTPEIKPQLTRDQISQIRTELTQQLAALEEHEKALLPKTAEELDAREKELAAELDRLKGVRAELKKK
jgi:hypothetical protein